MIAAEDEARLLLQLRRGGADREAGLRELHDRTRAGLFGLALRMTGRPELADDAVQETFVDILRGLDGFRGEARLTSWLYRIAVRAATRVSTRAGRRAGALPEELIGGRDPADSAAERDSAARVLTAIRRLPAHQRAVVALSALKDLPQTEVAAILGVPEGTVYSRLHAARRQLAEWLGGDVPQPKSGAAAKEA